MSVRRGVCRGQGLGCFTALLCARHGMMPVDKDISHAGRAPSALLEMNTSAGYQILSPCLNSRVVNAQGYPIHAGQASSTAYHWHSSMSRPEAAAHYHQKLGPGLHGLALQAALLLWRWLQKQFPQRDSCPQLLLDRLPQTRVQQRYPGGAQGCSEYSASKGHQVPLGCM